MAKEETKSDLDYNGMRDDTIKTIINQLTQLADIPSDEPNAKLLKSSIKKVINAYNDGYKDEKSIDSLSERGKKNLYKALKNDFAMADTFAGVVNKDTKINDNSYNKSIEIAINQANLAFTELTVEDSSKIKFANVDKKLEEVDKIITAQEEKNKTQVKLKSSSANNIDEINSVIKDLEALNGNISENIKKVDKDGKLLKAFNATVSPFLTEMYNFRDKIMEQKELYREKYRNSVLIEADSKAQKPSLNIDTKTKIEPESSIHIIKKLSKRLVVYKTANVIENLGKLKDEILKASKEHEVGALIKKDYKDFKKFGKDTGSFIVNVDSDFNDLIKLVKLGNKLVQTNIKVSIAVPLVATKALINYSLKPVKKVDPIRRG